MDESLFILTCCCQHEVGHNLGMRHSSDITDSIVEYGDRSGVMGISYLIDDGPSRAKMCFKYVRLFLEE